MDNRTEINPINNGGATEINEQLSGNVTEINNSLAGNSTVINTAVDSGNAIPVETVLCGKYQITSKLDIVTGEADLYICSYNNENYVAKVYRRKVAIKPEIIELLKKIDSPFVAKTYETGEYNGFPFEILPYYKNGSLQGKKFEFDELKNHIIPSINEGLRVLHQNQIIHKDLKPSNIMLLDNGHDVAIIDFGISSVRENGNTVLMTKTGMTPEYSAPETFRNLFLEESDYYSLGITLFELFCGYTPYSNMSSEQIEQFVSVQRIPIPSDMPSELSDFINALTYYDITNRKNKDNPNRRWTYTEVKNWCEGKPQTIPGEGIGNTKSDMPPYKFNGATYTNMLMLVKALAQNWQDGKKQLFRGLLSGFFKNSNPEIAGFCMDAEDEARAQSGNDDFIFWKLLYKLSPDLKGFYWQGLCYESLPAFGREILEKLWSGKIDDCKCYDSVLEEDILEEYIKIVAPGKDKQFEAVKGLDTSFKMNKNDKRERTKIYYLLGYMLSGQRMFCIDGNQFRTVGELADYMKSLLEKSYEDFQTFCHRLIDFRGTLDVGFESWLISLGKTKELEQWRETLV